MFERILIGVVGIVISFILVKYRYWIEETFGSSSWAERYLGSTELGLVLLAIIIFIFSLMFMTGKLSGILQNTVGTIF